MRENTQSNMYFGLHNQTEKYWFQMTAFWVDVNKTVLIKGRGKANFDTLEVM